MKTRLLCCLGLLVLLLGICAPLVSADEGGESGIVSATVEYVRDEHEETFLGKTLLVQELELSLTSGPHHGEIVTVEYTVQTYAGQEPLKPGALVYLQAAETSEGIHYDVTTRSRWLPLAAMALLFAVLVVGVGHGRGLASLAGLAFSFVIIFVIVLPHLQAGRDPFWAVLVAAAITLPISYALAHGINLKSGVALAGSLMGIVVTGLMALAAVAVSHLTGYAAEEMGFLQAGDAGTWDVRGLLLAGIMIGVLGVLDDITVAQAGTVQQIHETDRKLSWQALYRRAMRVGQDHIASMVNTLALVYAGSSLGLLLLLRGSSLPLGYLLSQEAIAEEIVRMIVTSAGLVSAVPVTTALAALAFTRHYARQHAEDDSSEPPTA